MYEKYRELSPGNYLAGDGNGLYVLRRINAEDVPVFRKISSIININLARVYEITVLDDETFAVTEYIQGDNLNDYIAADGVLPEKTAAAMMTGICNAASALHNAGIVHRDIKPSNIIITRGGIPVLTDFGISRIGTGSKTSDTEILGTAGYAAPEQFGFRETDCRTDIYSLGIVLNFILTGKTPGEMHAQGKLSPVVDRCTAMDPVDRYASADEMTADISKKTGYTGVTVPRAEKKKTAAIAGLIIYLTAVAFCIIAEAEGTKAPESPAEGVILLFVVLVILPALFFNIFHWQDRIPMGNLSHSKRRGLAIALGAAITVTGFAVLCFTAAA